MTTPSLRPRLARIARRALLARLTRGLGRWLAPVLGALLALCALDNLVHLPAGLRVVGALALLGLLAWGFLTQLWRAARSESIEGTARRIEEAAGIADNVLINACQFEGLALAGHGGIRESAFARATQAAGHGAMLRLPWARLLELRALALWLALAAVALAAWGAYAAVLPDHLRNALQRVLLPLADVPPLGAVVLAVTPAGPVTVYDGESVTVTVDARTVAHIGLLPEVPQLVRAEGATSLDEALDAGERIALTPVSGGGQRYTVTFPNLHRSFAFRATCGGSWSAGVAVTVLPPPALRSARFTVTGPAYSGAQAAVRPGPPATLAVLPGSRVVLALALDQHVQALQWRVAGGAIALSERNGEWSGETVIAAASPYELVVPADGGLPERVVARGAIQIEADRPPQVELVADDRNRFVDPGQRLAVEVAASDDLGLSVVALWAHEATDPTAAFMIKEWRYIGPPGNPGPVKERHALIIAPERFLPGKTYVVEAIARDFAPLAAASPPATAQPVGQLARSQPLLLRVRSVADLALPAGDPLAAAFALLKQTLAEQQRARAVAANMAVNLDDIHRHNTFAPQRQAATGAEDAAHATADKAIAAFAAAKDAGTLAQLRPLVEGAMVQLRADLGALADDAQAAKRLDGLIVRQDEVIARLIALIGALAEGDRTKAEAKAKAKPTDAALDGERAKMQDKAEALKDDLERFARDQRRILERSRTLADKGPADLSSDEEKILGELAHEEKAWAKFLEEKLTDFSKLPGQDFADGRLADEFNEVWQDIKASAAALDAKAAEIAVPREGAGLEKAEKLVHNLERWMAESSDKTKWSMEDTGAPADVPLAELPKELEDIIGDLIDKEQEMTDDVQDVSSKWNDSIDKGAGWGAGDGPISNMSAKGITGNSLPNKNEVGGRSGEGRNGRSSGQMVEATAQGKGGQETPTRLSASPFEQGSVKDESKDSNGGATGGGKQAGFAAEGLRGPTPPPALQQAMARLAGKQAAIRQQAGALAIKLRAQHLPTGDLESAVQAMGQVQDAAQAQRGGAIKARYSAALDALGEARQAVGGEARLQHERSHLPEKVRQQIMAGSTDRVPPGYEDMVGTYFQALAGAQ